MSAGLPSSTIADIACMVAVALFAAIVAICLWCLRPPWMAAQAAGDGEAGGLHLDLNGTLEDLPTHREAFLALGNVSLPEDYDAQDSIPLATLQSMGDASGELDTLPLPPPPAHLP